MDRINANGVREVYCEADQKWYADTILDNGERYFLDERPDRFQYYPVDEDEDHESFMQRLLNEESAERDSGFGKE